MIKYQDFVDWWHGFKKWPLRYKIGGLVILVGVIFRQEFVQLIKGAIISPKNPPSQLSQTVLGDKNTQVMTTGPNSSVTSIKIDSSVRESSAFSKATDKIERLKELSDPYRDGGSFKSYLRLVSMENQELSPEIKDFLFEEVKKIESWYTPHPLQMNIFAMYPNYICKQHINCSQFEPKTGFDARNVITHLGFPHWQERAKAAVMLLDIKTAINKDLTAKEKENLFQKLIDCMNPDKETSLYAAKMALETYKNFASFNPDSIGVLEFDKAIGDWSTLERRAEILKKDF